MSPSAISQITGLSGATPRKKPDDPARIQDAAQQFEALLIGQMLKTARESSGGWLGSGSDSSSDCATEYAEQQFAAVLAKQGGLGLKALISNGLVKEH